MFQENVLYMQVIHQKKPYSSHCSDHALECKTLKTLTKLIFSYANCNILPVPKTHFADLSRCQYVFSFFVRKCLQNKLSGLVDYVLGFLLAIRLGILSNNK